MTDLGNGKLLKVTKNFDSSSPLEYDSEVDISTDKQIATYKQIRWEDEGFDLIPRDIRNIRVAQDQSYFISEDVQALDQSSETGTNQSSLNDLWQSATQGFTGNLVQVSIHFTQTPSPNAQVLIYEGEGIGGTLLSSVPSASYTSGWNDIVLPTPPYILAGTKFTIRVFGSTSLWWTFDLSGSYPGGRFLTSPTADGRFRTYVLRTYYAAWKEGIAIVGDFKLISQNNTASSTTKIYNDAAGQVTELELNEGTTKVIGFSNDPNETGDLDKKLWTIEAIKSQTSGDMVREVLTISSDGQTSFTLGSIPADPQDVLLSLNGQLSIYGALDDFTISGTSLTWNDPNGLTLKTTDKFQIWYWTSIAGLSTSGKEVLIVTSDGQTSFSLSVTPGTPEDAFLSLNGQVSIYGVTEDFTISGSTLTWNNPDGLTLKTTDKFQIWYW